LHEGNSRLRFEIGVRVSCESTTFDIFYLEYIHSELSDASMYPIIGSFPAAAKTLLGIIEIMVSAIFFILAIIPSIFSQTARSLLAFSAIHIVRGFIRTLVGAILTVPVLGTIFICGLAHIAGGCCGIISLANGNAQGGTELGHSLIFA
jgi:hypothetical protein